MTTPLAERSVDAVAETIRHRIRAADLLPGQRLVEAALVADLGVPRARIRDALKILNAEGLVVLEEFRGASVREFTVQEVAQVYDVREVLDALAARLAAGRPRADFARLYELQTELDSCVAAGGSQAFVDLNAGWHAEILRLAANEPLTSALDRLHVPIFRLLFPVFSAPEIMGQANATMRPVTQAICDRKAIVAERTMKEHIRAGRAVIQGSSSPITGRR